MTFTIPLSWRDNSFLKYTTEYPVTGADQPPQGKSQPALPPWREGRMASKASAVVNRSVVDVLDFVDGAECGPMVVR